MKKFMMSLAVTVLTITGIQAQVNKTIKEESTTQRVVTREGSEVKVVETKKINTESGAVIIDGNNKMDQESREVTREDSDKKVLVDKVYVDEQNETMIAEKKMQQEAQLEASKLEQARIEAKRKLEYDAKQAQMQKDLAERRAQLETRPKGMAKLKKE